MTTVTANRTRTAAAGRIGKKERRFMRIGSTATTLVAAATATYVAAFAITGVRAQTTTVPRLQPTSLKSVPVPEPPNLADFVQDRAAAIRLGKAFFWEQQASSDSMMACASCHFHAGADNRIKNQLNPGQAGGSNVFDPVGSSTKGGPNYTLSAADFPFHRLSTPSDRESTVLYDTDEVGGASGVYNADFAKNLGPIEKTIQAPDGVFVVNGVETRRVTGRNAPTVINAVLNFRNFWDGRANFVFNGVTPFGPRDKDARIFVDDWYADANGVQVERAVPAIVRIPYASAASQAVGPALSGFEMSGAGRAFSDLGHKLLSTRPLLNQSVSATDSVLGKYRNPLGLGLTIANYETMIKAAFWPEYWQVPDAIYRSTTGATNRQIEQNFSLFWGLAIQMYEATLISDDSRFDRYAAGDRTQLTAQEQAGLAIFSGDRGRCVNCHKGAEFTGAATRMVLGTGADSFSGDGPIEHMLMGDRTEALYDNGFYNIGVVPSKNDVGVGGLDPWSNPLSFSRQLKGQLDGTPAPDAMSHSLNPCDFQTIDGCIVVTSPHFRDAVDGSFKTPTLRNVELTGPYFHNGGYATLEQVVDFYSRGGNVRQAAGGDTSGITAISSSNLDSDVMSLGLTPTEKAALVAFLKSLTDDRVRYEKAPFDHPSLKVPHGAKGDNNALQLLNGKAIDEFLVIPAVGATGLTTPILPFTPKP
jgi:cytochrome c peroxidase